MKAKPAPSELLLRNGTLVSHAETLRADLLIRDGRIAAIGESLPSEGETLDVAGWLVMPGGVDTHVHLQHLIERLGVVTADDFYSGTAAAACGGTTTIIDFALQRRGEPVEEAVARRMEQARSSVIDYGLHVILTDLREDVLAEIPRLIDKGLVSFKLYTTFGDKRIDDAGLMKVFEQTALHGGLAYVHAENDGAIRHFIQRSIERGQTGPWAHATSRPPLTEAEAVYRVIVLAQLAEARVIIAHVTSKQTLEVIEHWRRRGARVHCETCPQYLVLTEEKLAPSSGAEAARYVCTPPLRAAEHLDALWEGVQKGAIDQVSSDHSCFSLEQREADAEDFTRIPNGLPGIETRLCLLFSEGVARRRISLNRFVELVSTAPAQAFGLFPRKGSLAVGTDADLVVWDPEAEWSIDHRKLHQLGDYSPYQGMRIRGAPRLTFSRGELVADNGQPAAARGRGRFLERQRLVE